MSVKATTLLAKIPSFSVMAKVTETSNYATRRHVSHDFISIGCNMPVHKRKFLIVSYCQLD